MSLSIPVFPSKNQSQPFQGRAREQHWRSRGTRRDGGAQPGESQRIERDAVAGRWAAAKVLWL